MAIKILHCPHAKGVSRFAPEPDRKLEEEYKGDVCPFYISRNLAGAENFLICPIKIEEKNRN